MAKKNVLVLNCGSSSLKFAVLNSDSGEELISGLAERLGQDDAIIKFKQNGDKTELSLTGNKDHADAIAKLLVRLQDQNLDQELFAVGHRVVHGGESFTQSALIDQQVFDAISEVSDLAPLHNPANLIGITAAQQAFPELPQIAVFDTAFHQSMPAKAFLYAIDYQLYKSFGLRKYGFHGTSHYYVSKQAAAKLNQDVENTSVITVHLGNGCSICAVENGQSVDTSLGLTPLSGLVMGTRSGDVDPGLILFLQKQKGYTPQQIDDLLNKQSGLLGLSQLSNDCRTLEEAMSDSDAQKAAQATLAMDVFCYRVSQYIASYTAALSHLDAVVFTGGIGENSDYVRETVIKHLSILGLSVDSEKNLNARFGQAGAIHSEASRFPVLVIPTNEELVIAQDAASLAKEK